MNESPTAIVLTSYPLPRAAELLHPIASHRIVKWRNSGLLSNCVW